MAAERVSWVSGIVGLGVHTHRYGDTHQSDHRAAIVDESDQLPPHRMVNGKCLL